MNEREHFGEARDDLDEARELREAPVEFTSELGVAPASPLEMEAADDPEGYIGPDGLAAPHERPGQVREHYDDALDRLPRVSLDDVEELSGSAQLGGAEDEEAAG